MSLSNNWYPQDPRACWWVASGQSPQAQDSLPHPAAVGREQGSPEGRLAWHGFSQPQSHGRKSKTPAMLLRLTWAPPYLLVLNVLKNTVPDSEQGFATCRFQGGKLPFIRAACQAHRGSLPSAPGSVWSPGLVCFTLTL